MKGERKYTRFHDLKYRRLIKCGKIRCVSQTVSRENKNVTRYPAECAIIKGENAPSWWQPNDHRDSNPVPKKHWQTVLRQGSTLFRNVNFSHSHPQKCPWRCGNYATLECEVETKWCGYCEIRIITTGKKKGMLKVDIFRSQIYTVVLWCNCT